MGLFHKLGLCRTQNSGAFPPFSLVPEAPNFYRRWEQVTSVH
jgi:hypothetical protein